MPRATRAGPDRPRPAAAGSDVRPRARPVGPASARRWPRPASRGCPGHRCGQSRRRGVPGSVPAREPVVRCCPASGAHPAAGDRRTGSGRSSRPAPCACGACR
ncbi:hypothetical protein G6F57_021605 [Rhizopus arrhizus]|nr:hypothetical protein G6F57_021605 [Rhizopus arrhizus]